MRHAAKALLLVVLVVPAAGAGEGFDFARELVEKKLYDIAEEEFNKILADPSRTPEERAEGELGLALVARARALDARTERGREASQVLALFAEAERRLEEFLTRHPVHPRLGRAAFDAGHLAFTKGEYIRSRAEEGAEAAYRSAITLFARAERALPEGWDRERARFHHSVLFYYLGRGLPADGVDRRAALDEAAERIDDFLWDHGEDVLGGYAYLYYGLVKKSLGDPDGAIELFRVVLSYPLPDAASFPRDHEIWSELLLQAGQVLGEYACELGGKTLEIAVVELPALRGKIPDALERKFGHLMLLTLARVLFDLGRRAEALELLTELSRRAEDLAATRDWAAATGRRTSRLLDELFHDEPHTLSADVLYRVAEGRMSAGRYREALLGFMGTIAAGAPGSPLSGRAWERSARCYYQMERFLEAYFAFGLVMRRFTDLAGDAAYWRYRSAAALYSETRDPRDEELMKRARREFATRFESHPRAADLLYDEGADLIAIGDAKRAAGAKEQAEGLYLRALDLLARTGSRSVLYAKALARRGEALVKLGRHREALEVFDGILHLVDDPDRVTTDQRRLTNRRHARAIAAYYAALAHAALDEWSDALHALGDYEQMFTDEALEGFHPPVKFERVRAWLGLQRLDDAEREARALRKRFSDSPWTSRASLLLSRAFHAAAERAEGEAERRLLLGKAAEHRALHLESKEHPTAHDHATVGTWFYRIGRWREAARSLEEARRLGAGRRTSSLLADALLRLGEFGPARDILEELLIPDPGARERVLALLLVSEHTASSLRELIGKIRADREEMERLARAYKGLGGSEDLLRGLSLLDLLLRDRERRYSEDWWRLRLLRSEILLDYGMAYRSRDALQKVIDEQDRLGRLGVLERSGLAKEFGELRRKAKELLR
ncbi:MAG: hypothetical protein ACYTDY_11520 [Planctomycetota bacterium]|jgi:tetratricopeptide (TPR) repeat protein